MIIRSGLFTSESVSDGHPDKICDQISDAILDACLTQDPLSRVAVETACKDNVVFLLGEITTQASVDYIHIVKQVLSNIGHTTPMWGMDLDHLQVVTQISQQSPDIARGINESLDMGAGDQGMMFGFACDETDTYLPLPIFLAHQLMRRQKTVRQKEGYGLLGPDAKAQVTIRYHDGRPQEIVSVVLSTQHAPQISAKELQELVREVIFLPVLPDKFLTNNTKYHINPTGQFIVGGPASDAGVTGRKIIVDTYGGYARHGGGAFSGKDPTKVDRSAAYAARQLARHVVAEKLAHQCEVQVAYAIGVAHPVAISFDTFDTSSLSEDQIYQLLSKECNLEDQLRPYSIIQRLQLRKPIYTETAAYGHFGKSDLPWEKPFVPFINPQAASHRASL